MRPGQNPRPDSEHPHGSSVRVAFEAQPEVIYSWLNLHFEVPQTPTCQTLVAAEEARASYPCERLPLYPLNRSVVPNQARYPLRTDWTCVADLQ